MKKTFYSELAYIVGLLFLGFGTALMERADFGMSMVVAPAYILHLKLSQFMPFFSFGMAEYCLQFVLIVLLSAALRKFKKGYFFSFITAVIYGFILDFFITLISFVPGGGAAFRACFFVFGLLSGSVGVAVILHTYLAPEAYELVVKEVSSKTNIAVSKVKTVYDLTSLLISLLLSFCFFGFMHFEGVKLGTLITALLNGFLIGRISAFLERHFEFKDRFGYRRAFEE